MFKQIDAWKEKCIIEVCIGYIVEFRFEAACSGRGAEVLSTLKYLYLKLKGVKVE